VVPVAYGREAAAELHARVSAAKRDDPLATVTVVVPTNYVGVAARRRLASGEFGPVSPRGSGIAGVTFLTVYRLAELLGAAALAAAGRRPVSTPVVAAALRSVLGDAPGIFAGVADHPATEEAFVAAFRELADVSAGGADAVARRSPRAADVVRICAEARRRLASGWYDEADLVESAVGTAKSSALTEELGDVLVYLPQDLSRGGARLLQTVAERTPLAVLAGRTGDDDADADVSQSLERLGAPVDGYRRFPPAVPGGEEAELEVLSASDAEDEVRSVVRRIIEAARAGIPLERIAVLYGSREPYARLLHEQLGAAGISFNGTSVRPISERLAGRVLLSALGLVDRDMRRSDLMGVLCSGAVLNPSGGFVPASAWERMSREAGVVSGDDWDRRLGVFAAAQESEAALRRGEPDSPEWLVDRFENNANQARALRGYVSELRDTLEHGRTLTKWADLAAWARALLHDLLGTEAATRSWPAEERRAAEKVETALGRLGHLDSVAASVDLAAFRRTLELELDSDLGRTGRLGQGVLVGGLASGMGLDVDLVAVLGMAEGTVPSRGGEDPLLSDADRGAAQGELRLRSDTVQREHRQLLGALACARAHRHMSFPRGDLRRNSERIPSRWVLDTVSAMAGRRIGSDELMAMDAPAIRHRKSFAAGITRVPFPATEQEYRIRALAEPGSAPSDQIVLKAFELVSARRSSAFTRFDGNLSGSPVPSLAGRSVSPTALEAYAACPHSYLLGHVLRVKVVENPEIQLAMTSLDYGNLLHEVLEGYVSDRILQGTAPEPDAHAGLHSVFDAVSARFEQAGLCGRAPFWRRDRRRLTTDLDRFLDEDAAMCRELRCRPIATEEPFGAPGPEVHVALPGGGAVSLRGRMDRIDEAGDGTLVVIDYKTGSSDYYSNLDEGDPDAGGTRLQLPAYALAARAVTGRSDTPVEAYYWFVTTRGGFKRVGYRLTPEIADRFAEVLGTIDRLIADGVFPSRGHDVSYSGYNVCPYCDPDGLGCADLVRAWERKRSAPELGEYRAVYDPDVGGSP